MTQRIAESMRWVVLTLVAAGCSTVPPASVGPGSSAVVMQALALLDAPYLNGGSSPAGFDCSGLVHYVYKNAAGLELPRRSEDMSRVGRPIRASDLQPGDLVFFNTLRRAYSHVAIYVGDGRFLHSPASGGRVRIEALNERYWKHRYDGARRLLDDARPAAGQSTTIEAGDNRVGP